MKYQDRQTESVNETVSYQEYFKKQGESWNMNMDGSSHSSCILPVTVEFAKQNLLYLESMTMNLNTPDGFYMQRQDYESYQICYTTQGHGRLIYDEKEYDFYPGDCFFIDCRKKHYYCTVGPADWIHHGMQIRGHQLETVFEKFYDQHSVKVSLGTSEKLLTLFAEIAGACDYNLVNNEWIVNLLLWELVTKIVSCDQIVSRVQLPERLANVCRYIEQNYAEIHSLDDIARKCYISKFYLCHEFKKKMGQTVGEYLTLVKINQAKRLLLTTELAVEEVAFAIGYTPNYFIYIFKNVVGITPLKYKKNNTAVKSL